MQGNSQKPTALRWGPGNPDIIAPESGIDGSSVDVYLGTGSGTFAAAENYSCASRTLGASQPYAVGDFNGDGLMDIAVARRTQRRADRRPDWYNHRGESE